MSGSTFGYIANLNALGLGASFGEESSEASACSAKRLTQLALRDLEASRRQSGRSRVVDGGRAVAWPRWRLNLVCEDPANLSTAAVDCAAAKGPFTGAPATRALLGRSRK
ncbi:MAG TPA: hypothetical protein VMK12_11650 [Anaeromyxobacteraceae bacterium]|nr:hypothetical protein [Anaeromyxobacteraceae bacterium]